MVYFCINQKDGDKDFAVEKKIKVFDRNNFRCRLSQATDQMVKRRGKIHGRKKMALE